ncbi:uncharacterized protein LOC132616966 [Lycium barbarum]|uniref:uncharacterized protein LOC132616966 n=1 Tax=Lycium barbarum TaxID=112863 RepID=UPI00293E996A|nr:uncharacterized protein LOC132616966 [Lycium barbarum]
MHKLELSGRLAKWAVEISGYDTEYKPRTTIKSQILADFVEDFTSALIPKVERVLALTSGKPVGVWTLHTDGASNIKGSGLDIVLRSPAEELIRQSIKISSKLTNNEAEYEPLIAGLKLARGLGAEIVEAMCDSLLVVNQINGTFEVKDDRMQKYLEKVEVVLHRFKEWMVQHTPREQNTEADALANLGSSVEAERLSSGAIFQLMSSVIESNQVEVNAASLTWDWRNKYMNYLADGKLPSDWKESRALRTKAARYCIVDGKLYRHSFYGPLARCLGLGEADYAMREVHEGTCDNHSGVELLVRKLIWAGYYWDHMEIDAKNFIRKCDQCQRHAPVIHQPSELFHPILSPWPFMKWRMDIVGPLPSALGKARFILFMTNYFSKWVEA